MTSTSLSSPTYSSSPLPLVQGDKNNLKNRSAEIEPIPQKIIPPTVGARSRPTHQLRREASFLKKLELDAALEREKFGLADLLVSTSPDGDEVFVPLDLQKMPDSLEMDKSDAQSQSQVEGNPRTAMLVPSQNIPSPSTPLGGSARTPIPTVVPSSSSRLRAPVPPSPLSRIQATSLGVDKRGDIASPSQFSNSLPARALSFQEPQASPCFIHSHLDRHGSLQDWLRNKGNHHAYLNQRDHLQPPPSPSVAGTTQSNNGPVHLLAVGSHHPQTHRQAGHHPFVPPRNHQTPNGSSPIAPIRTSPPIREPSASGYESDRSSAGNGQYGATVFENSLMDDDEELGSLTRQLAETAQGVREMSKELGRTRVRSRIQHVLIVTKARDNRLIKLTRELAIYLMNKTPSSSSNESTHRTGSEPRGMVVYVDAQLRTSKRFDASGMERDFPHLFQPVHRRRSSSSASVNTLSAVSSSSSMMDMGRRSRDEGQLRYWTSDMCSSSPHLFDFVVTLGGDGTVLFTSWLFQKIVPPVLPFALGSLGFLTNFDFASYKETMDKVIDDGIRVNLRMRFTCTVYRAIAPEETAATTVKGSKKRKAIKRPGGEILMSQVDKGGWEALEGHSNMPPKAGDCKGDKEIMCFSTRPVEQFEVLNDLVVDRGPSPYVSLLELFGDEHHLTTVQADGLTVSTPTGSTAYSLSAGGSLVHPQIPALLITPICPHTLSFRPMLLPDSMELRICVPYNSRSTAWASFDGRGRVELKQGDHIKVTASKYPFPTVCADKQSTDWFSSISRTLRWNEREKQKSFVVVEEDHEPPSKGKVKKGLGHSDVQKKQQENPSKITKGIDENLDSEEEDDDEDDNDSDGKNEEDEDEDEDGFDIDDKSGEDTTTPSSPPSLSINPHPHHPLHKRHQPHLDSHKSGVDSPDRFVTHYQAPPPLSQRHLVEALAAAEITGKDNEEGQRDDIRNEDSHAFRVQGHHLIPPGRSNLPFTSAAEIERTDRDAKTPRARSHGSAAEQSQSSDSRGGHESKAKAFAFFGQDDSASDMSDDPSE